MTGGFLGFVWIFWVIAIRMLDWFAAGKREPETDRWKKRLFAAVCGGCMTVLTCSFWWLAALFVIAAGAAVTRKASYGAPLVLAAALALAIVTAVFGSAVHFFDI